MATVTKRKQGSRGRVYLSELWHVRYGDHAGKRRRVAAFADKRASEAFGRLVDELVACRATSTPPTARLAAALDRLPARLLAHLRSAGLLDEAQTAGAQRLEDHLRDWAEHLRGKGDAERHVRLRTARAQRLLADASATWWADIKAERVEAALARARDVEGLSVATVNGYRSAVKGFSRWLYQTGRAPDHPLRHLAQQNPAAHRRHPRRALTADECRRLLDATRSSTMAYQGMGGPERALLYWTALETGLRANELHTLCVHHLALDGSPPTVHVEAAHSKARREATLPLRPALAAALREHCRDKMPAAPVFTMPKYARTAAMLRADLDAAGVAYRDSSGRVADFHALRVTFITNLARSGVHPRVAQELARHSTLELTMQVYTHVALDTKTEAVSRLPGLEPGAVPAETQART